jgi:hypothetical protein
MDSKQVISRFEAERQASKIPVSVQLLIKSRPEIKMLYSLCRFLVDLLATNGEIMVFKSVYGKSQSNDPSESFILFMPYSGGKNYVCCLKVHFLRKSVAVCLPSMLINRQSGIG